MLSRHKVVHQKYHHDPTQMQTRKPKPQNNGLANSCTINKKI